MQKNNYFRSSTYLTLFPPHHPQVQRGPAVEKSHFTKILIKTNESYTPKVASHFTDLKAIQSFVMFLKTEKYFITDEYNKLFRKGKIEIYMGRETDQVIIVS